MIIGLNGPKPTDRKDSHRKRYYEIAYTGVLGYDEIAQVWNERSCPIAPSLPTRAWFQNKASAFYRILKTIPKGSRELYVVSIKASIKRSERLPPLAH